MTTTLTERQQREREYYDQYSQRYEVGEVNFDPVVGDERRPWNSYWFTYRTIADLFRHPGQKLLDVGCGDGVASVRYAKAGYEVHGFDISENNVAKCRDLAARCGLADRTHFSVQTAEATTYDADTFDVVAGIDILHHVDIPRTVREVRRILVPGGTAVFREWIEVPILDDVRKTTLMQRLFPKAMSFDNHITHDEHPLTKEEFGAICDTFPLREVHRFCLTSRLRKVAPAPRGDQPCQLEKLDRSLIRAVPPLRHFGGEIVMVLHKQA